MPLLQLVLGKVKKDSTYWCKKYGIKDADILEYTGWKNKGWKEPITEMEFCRSIANSTVRDCEGRDRVMVGLSAQINSEKIRPGTFRYHRKVKRSRNELSSKEITLRYLHSLEVRVNRLERREYLWIAVIFASIGVNIGQYVGII